MIGLAALPREPSVVWQAAQTAVEIAAPLAGSGLAAGGGSAAMRATPAGKRRASDTEQSDTGFMREQVLVPKPAILQ